MINFYFCFYFEKLFWACCLEIFIESTCTTKNLKIVVIPFSFSDSVGCRLVTGEKRMEEKHISLASFTIKNNTCEISANNSDNVSGGFKFFSLSAGFSS